MISLLDRVINLGDFGAALVFMVFCVIYAVAITLLFGSVQASVWCLKRVRAILLARSEQIWDTLRPRRRYGTR